MSGFQRFYHVTDPFIKRLGLEAELQVSPRKCLSVRQNWGVKYRVCQVVVVVSLSGPVLTINPYECKYPEVVTVTQKS